MKKVTFEEILDIAAYERARSEIRPRLLALKERRRTPVGEHMTLTWENHETARYQIQEMMRIERIVQDEAIRHELETYNELVPGQGELKATLLIEYPTPEERDMRLRGLVGLERCFWLQVEGCEPVAAAFDPRQQDPRRLSAVQFLTFRLPETARQRLLAGGSAKISVRHAAYNCDSPLFAENLAELRADLASP